MVTTTYGVQAGNLSSAIHVGRINAAGTEFLDKQDLTPEVLHAVAEWVERHYDGSAWVRVGGRRLSIDVVTESESLRAVDEPPSAEVLIRAVREQIGTTESQHDGDSLMAQLADRMEIMLLALRDLESEDRGWEYGVAENAVSIERNSAALFRSKKDAVDWMADWKKRVISGDQLCRRRPERHLPASKWEPVPNAE